MSQAFRALSFATFIAPVPEFQVDSVTTSACAALDQVVDIALIRTAASASVGFFTQMVEETEPPGMRLPLPRNSRSDSLGAKCTPSLLTKISIGFAGAAVAGNAAPPITRAAAAPVVRARALQRVVREENVMVSSP